MENVYLLDANVIRRLNYKSLAIASKHSMVRTVEEVKFEVASLDKTKLVAVDSLTSDSYAMIQELMKTYECVRLLLDYVRDEGAADVALLAWALTSNYGKLLPEDVYIVTEDADLARACGKLRVKCMGVDDFRKVAIDPYESTLTDPSVRNPATEIVS